MVTMDLERRIFSCGAVAVSGGRIVGVGTDAKISEEFDAKETIDAGGGIVHPGFIDAHNHVVHTSCRGVGDVRSPNPSSANFADWKAGVTDDDEEAAVAMASVEMLRAGFTMFIEPGSLFSTGAGAESVGRVGIRALFAPLYVWDRQECFDAVPSLMSPSLAARASIDHGRVMGQIGAELHRNKDPEALVRGFVFVYGAGTASPELLQAAYSTARDNQVPFHLHAGFVPGEGPIYKAINGKSHIVHLRDLGVLDESTALVHANVVDDEEEDAIRESGCKIVWCPAAFFALGFGGSAKFRMAERYREGTLVSLGVDGAVGCTPGHVMLAGHFASQTYSDPVSPEALLEMQTINAAAAAGMDAELGSLEPGKRADLVIRSAGVAEAYPSNNPIHLLALTMGSGSVDTVLVNGKTVFRWGHSTRVDEERVYRRVSESVAARAKRLGIDAGPGWPAVG